MVVMIETICWWVLMVVVNGVSNRDELVLDKVMHANEEEMVAMCVDEW